MIKFEQTIIITWGAGFIGSHFLNTYVKNNPNIFFVNLDSITYAWDINRIDQKISESQNYAFERVDIGDYKIILGIYKRYRPTGTIHFAAETHVDRSITGPDLFFQTNIIGTKNLLDAHKEFSDWRFHYVSTDEVYGDNPWNHLSKETDMLYPSSPYAASKAGAEMLVMSYGRTYGIDYTISRGSNTYGINQYPEKLIPYSLKRLREGNTVTLYGDGENIRDWIYVSDHNEAIWEIFTHWKQWEIYNVGAHNLLSNNELINFMLELTRNDDKKIEYIPDRAWHDRRYALNTKKIEKELGWKSKSHFRETFKEFIYSQLWQ